MTTGPSSSPSSSTLQLHLTIAQLQAFLDEAFPTATRQSLGEIELLALNHLRMRRIPDETTLRPGNIVSGPTQMALVDVAAYAVIAAHRGPERMAVTNALSINFLRPCLPEPIIADARILKMGRRLATIDVRVWQGTEDRLVAQSTVGYALP